MLELDRIYCMDCLEGMKHIEDKSIDLVLTDPPYFNIANEDWDRQWIDYDEFLIWFKSILSEINRVLKDTGSCYIFTAFGNQFNKLTDILYNGNNFKIRNMILWWRETPGFKQSIKRFTINYEIIWFITKGDTYIWNLDAVRVKHWREFDKRENPLGKSPGCIWYEFNLKIGKHKEATAHPTQKPLALINRMIQVSSNESSIVLDPFVGSGTTPVSCKRLNRHFIGFEFKKEYCAIAEKRLKNIPERLDKYVTEG